jgi:hypothetical protein
MGPRPGRDGAMILTLYLTLYNNLHSARRAATRGVSSPSVSLSARFIEVSALVSCLVCSINVPARRERYGFLRTEVVEKTCGRSKPLLLHRDVFIIDYRAKYKTGGYI